MNNKILKFFHKNRKYIMVFFLLFISSMSFWYMDTQSNTRHSMNIWKALFEGRFFEFYSYNIASAVNGETVHKAVYEVFLYTVLAIWNLPLYIIEKIIGGNILDFFPAKVYAKLFLIVLVFAAGKLTEQIAVQCGLEKEKAEECFFLFVGSAAVFSSSAVIGQIDIIGLVFILSALLAYMKNEKLKFYILFIMAYQCKFFAMVVFIPLILLKEKNPIKILIKVGLPVVIANIINIPFKIADPAGMEYKSEIVGVEIDNMLAVKQEFMGTELPYILLLFGGVCMLAYLIKEKNDYEKNLQYIYYAFIGLAAAFFVFSSPYRTIYIIPFMVILLVKEERNYNIRFILFHAVMVGLLLGNIIEFRWCYDFAIMYDMLCDILLPFHKFELLGVDQLSHMIRSEQFHNIWTIFYSLFVVYLIGFAFVHFPGRKEHTIFNDCDKSKEDKMEEKKYLFVFIINYLVSNIAVVLLIFSVIRNIFYKFY